MMKSILLSCVVVIGLLAEQNDIQIFTTANKDKNITAQTIQKALEKAGFFVSENRDMNVPFKKQFNESDFEVYNLLTFYKRDVAVELAKKYDNMGLFTPMSMSIYTRKGEGTISVSVLSSEAMARIMKIPVDEALLTKLGVLVVKALKEALPNAKLAKLAYRNIEPKAELVTTFTMEMDVEEWEDEFEELKMSLEGELSPKGFVIAGHNNLGDLFEDAGYDGFDFYEVYSICKLPVIFTIAKTRPEAGAFAPCSLYLEKRKEEKRDEHCLSIGLQLDEFIGINREKETKVLEEAQKQMREILTSVTE